MGHSDDSLSEVEKSTSGCEAGQVQVRGCCNDSGHHQRSSRVLAIDSRNSKPVTSLS